jgi:colanic acid/amylovoran biosynthesis glycosyltransferase
MISKPIRLGYLTSVYGRASDTFIRSEVAVLRSLGHEVRTFSIRRPPSTELVSDEIRAEQAETEAVLDVGLPRLAASAFLTAVRSPRKMLEAIQLALRIRKPGLKGHLLPVVYLLEAAYLAGRLQAKGVEHLHNHIGENSAAVAMIAAAIAGIPYSLTIHGPGEFDRPTELALDVKIHRASFVAAVTEFGRSQLFRWSDYADWPKIRIIHCGVEPLFLDREPDLPPEAPQFVCVGRLAEQKGQLVLIEAAGRLASEGVDFGITLVGDGPMRKPIEKAIERLGLKGRVRLAGWMGAQGVFDEILKARALVLPSFAEGLPVVIMESLALGRPVISTYIAGIPELVEPGECGWLVPAGSVDALAQAMREALSSPVEELGRMGREGARRVAEQHDARIEARKLSALFAADISAETVLSPVDLTRLENIRGTADTELLR